MWRAVMWSLALAVGSLPAAVAQAGPATETPSLSAADESRLFRLGKVWGYLKYHHPAVRAGCFDWDAELLDELPFHVGLDDPSAGDRRLHDWLARIESGECDRRDEAPKPVHFRIDRRWLQDPQFLGPELSAKLTSLGPVKGREVQHYVTKQPGAGNPAFPHEPDYADVERLDWRYRVLALFRYWNIVEYWFPYRDLVDGWDEVLREFVPRLTAAEDPETYQLELMSLVARVEDGHANVWSLLDKRPPAGDLDVAAHVRWVEGKPLVWKVLEGAPDEAPADASDRLQFGDVILAVDGAPVEQLFERWRPYYGASNEAGLMRELCRSMLRGDKETVSVTIDRAGTQRELKLRRGESRTDYRPTHDRDGDAFQTLGEGVAYLKLSAVDAARSREYVESAIGHRGLIIDIRNYPSAFMVFELGRHLVAEPTPFARFTNVDLAEPGTVRWAGDPIELEPREPRLEDRVVVLVDEYAMSQSEYTAMAFRAAGAVIVGSQTAGADGNISPIILPGGHRTTISGIGVFYPDRTPTQKVGIVPDIPVRPTIAGIRAGRDEVLEAAVAQMLGDEFPADRIRAMTRLAHAPADDEEPAADGI